MWSNIQPNLYAFTCERFLNYSETRLWRNLRDRGKIRYQRDCKALFVWIGKLTIWLFSRLLHRCHCLLIATRYHHLLKNPSQVASPTAGVNWSLFPLAQLPTRRRAMPGFSLSLSLFPDDATVFPHTHAHMALALASPEKEHTYQVRQPYIEIKISCKSHNRIVFLYRKYGHFT